MKLLDLLSALLLIGAGLHLGLALVNVDLVGHLPAGSVAHKTLFGLMGAAAVYQFVQWRAIRRRVRG